MMARLAQPHRVAAALGLLILLALAGAAFAQQPGGLQGLVTRVVDGDTIYVALGDRIEVVRYIGINTPEIHHPTRGREPYGDAAREINRQLVEGKWVILVLDVQQRDRYGRLLAYVYIGDRFVNAELVHRGYAEASSYAPNVRYQEYFRDLERGARSAQRGLWADPESATFHRPRPPEESQLSSPRSGEPAREGYAMPHEAAGAVPGVTAPPRGTTPPSSTSGPVDVRGYTRRDGTYVAPHKRGRPQ